MKMPKVGATYFVIRVKQTKQVLTHDLDLNRPRNEMSDFVEDGFLHPMEALKTIEDRLAWLPSKQRDRYEIVRVVFHGQLTVLPPHTP